MIETVVRPVTAAHVRTGDRLVTQVSLQGRTVYLYHPSGYTACDVDALVKISRKVRVVDLDEPGIVHSSVSVA
ncbi:hypothetical protein GCM10023320_30900 [Pseudonocardia adelaidensis]|uniref:Uncharacterized protein n=1 Tax=Pseudonocardia adelaidensis TaxID=648754 RepID=A0ABP9NP22_9PSEU